MSSPILSRALAFGVLVVLGISISFFADIPRTSIAVELRYLEEHPTLSFQELSDYFSGIADVHGALYAYDILRRATLPPNTDTHLLGHVVGDALYRERGVTGIEMCTQEFRNACSHSIVIGVLTDEGEEGLSTIADACRKAPGGRGAYTMCFHGLGHGVFAYTGYDLPQTVSFCKRLGTALYRDREYIECMGGMLMELVGGMGGHDPDNFKKAQARYLRATDPLYPCNADIIPAEGKAICYTYLTPRLFGWGGGNLDRPGEPEFTTAFSICESISPAKPHERRPCFEGIGKEFPTLVQDRDIRRIDTLTRDELVQVAAWCELGDTTESAEACIASVVQSLFWGGENNPRAAAEFCLVASRGKEDVCYQELFNANAYYNAGNALAHERVCKLVPALRYAQCAHPR